MSFRRLLLPSLLAAVPALVLSARPARADGGAAADAAVLPPDAPPPSSTQGYAMAPASQPAMPAPQQDVAVSLGGSGPNTFSIPTGCADCAFALVHLRSNRLSSDHLYVTFDDPAMRFGTPVSFSFGTSDSDGATGNNAGGFWSPLHDVWTLAPLAADGTLSGTIHIGGWNASFCNGSPCSGPGTSDVIVQVVALFQPPSAPSSLLVHFPKARIPLYRVVGTSSFENDVALPAAVPTDAALYLGAVEEERISGDNTSLQVNGQDTQLATSDSSAFSGGGAGAVWSPIHEHEIAWPANAAAPDMLHVKLQTGGWEATHGSGVEPGLDVYLDGWVGGSTPGGELFYPGSGAVVNVTLDSKSSAVVPVPATGALDGHAPDIVVALVTVSRYASDWLQLQVGDRTLQLGTSSAHNNGNSAGALYDPVHTDLVFAHPTILDGTVTLPVQLTIGGFEDQQRDKPDFGIFVQFLGAFAPAPGTVSDGGMGGMSAAGCGCDAGRAGSGTSGGPLVILLVAGVGLVVLERRRRRSGDDSRE